MNDESIINYFGFAFLGFLIGALLTFIVMSSYRPDFRTDFLKYIYDECRLKGEVTMAVSNTDASDSVMVFKCSDVHFETNPFR